MRPLHAEFSRARLFARLLQFHVLGRSASYGLFTFSKDRNHVFYPLWRPQRLSAALKSPLADFPVFRDRNALSGFQPR